ncbi:MAG: organomercurial lyase [Gaiellaceae bacterium]
MSGGRLSRDVAATLAAADIPASKLGPARRARLENGERELYFWILRRFAAGGRPSSAQVREEAEQLGTNAERALESLAREDLVHLGGDGEIAVAYPFSGRPTAHRVRLGSGNGEVAAMCAIDALGMAPMLDESIEIASRDPVTDEGIRVRLAADGDGAWQPESTVVVSGALDRGDDSCCGCCPVLNFFASTENAEQWLAQHAEVRGHVVSMPAAIAAGRAVFGGVFDTE